MENMYVHGLPEEVWRNILQLLDFQSVTNFNSCCPCFRHVTNETPLRIVNLFRCYVSQEMLQLLTDTSHHLFVLNFSHVSSVQAADLLECLKTMKNLVTLDISCTALTIPSFAAISQYLPKLQNLTMDFLFSKENMQPQIMDKNILNKYKSAFATLKLIHFHAQDWILFNAFWKNSLLILEEANELFELRLTLYHEKYSRLNTLVSPEESESALRLQFKKLTIFTVTRTYFRKKFFDQFFFTSTFFRELTTNRWQFVLFSAGENIFDQVIVSPNLFEYSKVHCQDLKYIVEHDKLNLYQHHGHPSIFHIWHPSLFESNFDLGKEIVLQVEKSIPREVLGNNGSVMGLGLTINDDDWKNTEKSIFTSCFDVRIKAIAENITLSENFNILEHITTYIFDDNTLVGDDFFHHLFAQTPHLDTLILKYFHNSEPFLLKASKNIKFAPNLKTLQLSGFKITFKQWLDELISCKKIENVELHCASLDGEICRPAYNRFINQSKYLKSLLVRVEQHPEGDQYAVLHDRIKNLNIFFESAMEMYAEKSLYMAITQVESFTIIDAQREKFYPIYSKFLKPLQNLNVKYQE